MAMDKKEAYRILELSEGASSSEIKKARDRLALKWHPDKNNNSEESKQKFQEIQAAYEILNSQGIGGDSSNIDEDAIWLMKQKIENALNYSNVSKEEMEDETVKHYEEKLRKCKSKKDLEKFTSEVIFFIQIYARARDAGFFDKKGNSSDKWKQNSKPAPATETRSDTDFSTSSQKYAEFTCEWCKLRVKSDDPRPKYTFTGRDESFCSEECRRNWDSNDQWWKDYDEKKKKEAQEWEDYKRKQDQKWADYFRNVANSNYSSYSSYSYTPSSSDSSSSSNISSWLDEYKKSRERQKSENLAEDKKKYIHDVEFKLSLKSVSEEKLNKKLGVSNWRKKINECSDSMEAWSQKFNMENVIDKLSREYTCANCEAVKNNYYPWEKGGKKYCSLECQDEKDRKIKSHLGISNIKELFNWMRKMGATEIKFDSTTNQIIIKVISGEQKINIADSGLSQKLQQELKSADESITFNQVNDEFNRDKKTKNARIIGAVLIIVILLVVVIGVVISKNKKKSY